MSTGGLKFKSYVFEPVVIGTQTWAKTNYDFGGSYPNGDAGNVSAFGKLYTWAEATAINYPGWHLPTLDEVLILVTYLGGTLGSGSWYYIAGGKMKESGFDYWNSPNTGADNSSGFSGRAAGIMYASSSSCTGLMELAYFWTSTDSGTDASWYGLSQNTPYLYTGSFSKALWKVSVRLIKDS